MDFFDNFYHTSLKMEVQELNIIYNAINNYFMPRDQPIRTRLYRQLNYMEEREMYEMANNEPDGTIFLYNSRHNHRYYCMKIYGRVYHIVTNDDLTDVYSVSEIYEID